MKYIPLLLVGLGLLALTSCETQQAPDEIDAACAKLLLNEVK